MGRNKFIRNENEKHDSSKKKRSESRIQNSAVNFYEVLWKRNLCKIVFQEVI